MNSIPQRPFFSKWFLRLCPFLSHPFLFFLKRKMICYLHWAGTVSTPFPTTTLSVYRWASLSRPQKCLNLHRKTFAECVGNTALPRGCFSHKRVSHTLAASTSIFSYLLQATNRKQKLIYRLQHSSVGGLGWLWEGKGLAGEEPMQSSHFYMLLNRSRPQAFNMEGVLEPAVQDGDQLWHIHVVTFMLNPLSSN